eukprot:118769-Hanusia_phi.AAC.2
MGGWGRGLVSARLWPEVPWGGPGFPGMLFCARRLMVAGYSFSISVPLEHYLSCGAAPADRLGRRSRAKWDPKRGDGPPSHCVTTSEILNSKGHPAHTEPEIPRPLWWFAIARDSIPHAAPMGCGRARPKVRGRSVAAARQWMSSTGRPFPPFFRGLDASFMLIMHVYHDLMGWVRWLFQPSYQCR